MVQEVQGLKDVRARYYSKILDDLKIVVGRMDDDNVSSVLMCFLALVLVVCAGLIRKI